MRFSWGNSRTSLSRIDGHGVQRFDCRDSRAVFQISKTFTTDINPARKVHSLARKTSHKHPTPVYLILIHMMICCESTFDDTGTSPRPPFHLHCQSRTLALIANNDQRRKGCKAAWLTSSCRLSCEPQQVGLVSSMSCGLVRTGMCAVDVLCVCTVLDAGRWTRLTVCLALADRCC
jgi:hypothetical protein